MSITAAALIAASLLGANPPVPICGGPTASTHLWTTLDVEWTFSPGSATLASAPATTSGIAHVVWFVMVNPAVHEVCIEEGFTVFVVDTDADSGDALTETVGMSVYAQPINSDAYGESSVTMTATNGQHHSEALSVIGGYQLWQTVPAPTCIYSHDTLSIALGTGASSSAIRWIFNPYIGTNPGWTFSRTLHVEAYVWSGSGEIEPWPCAPGPAGFGGGDGPTPGAPELPETSPVTWYSSELEVIYSSGPPSIEVSQGVLATKSDGKTIRLGTMTDEEFDPQKTKDGYEINGDVNITHSLDPTGSVEVVHRLLTDTFARHDGNLNRDGQFCWLDRRLIADMVGATLGTAAYNARADFDLDGTIETSDYDAFFALWDAAVIAETVCEADFNCDGVANSTDVSDFTNQWFDDQANSTMQTDYDRNGVVNSTDASEFINNWYNGCP